MVTIIVHNKKILYTRLLITADDMRESGPGAWVIVMNLFSLRYTPFTRRALVERSTSARRASS